jgi:ferric-dicitrate binding protein FerR (iron transport regulator)
MAHSERDDLVWDKAWEWVVREHEQPLDAVVRQQLAAWLMENPSHRKAYDEAARIWLVSGLIPPPDDPMS